MFSCPNNEINRRLYLCETKPNLTDKHNETKAKGGMEGLGSEESFRGRVGDVQEENYGAKAGWGEVLDLN